MAGTPQKKVNVFVMIFVLFHAFMTFTWSLPEVQADRMQEINSGEGKADIGEQLLIKNAEVFKNWDTPSSMYLISTGLWQGWNMFAPNPASTDLWMDSVVTYEDGTADIQPYPRIYTMPILEKYPKERFRKYRENLTDDNRFGKWPHTAYRMALEAYRRTGKKPVRVLLRRHFYQVKAPDEEQLDGYTSYGFFETIIDYDYMMELEKK